MRLAVSAEGERLVLWASVPQVWMERRDSPADCLPEPPCRADFRLHDAELEAAGAIVDRFGNHRIADFAWEDIAAAAEGQTAALTFDMHREAAGVEFRVHDSLGSARR